MLGFREGRHTAIILHIARTGVIGGECMNDVAIKHVQHLGEVARATGDLQIGIVVIGRVDPEIARGTWHDLGKSEGPYG